MRSSRSSIVAVEKRIEPGATGLGSHGWTRPQAEVFADACRAVGMPVVHVIDRTAGHQPVLAVVARPAV